MGRVALFLLLGLASNPAQAQKKSVMSQSHDATVRIISKLGNSSGSGTFVSDRLVLTCFHVVFSGGRDPVTQDVTGTIFKDIVVVLPDGETIPADVVSIPTDAEQAPLQYDFAFLRLRQKPSKPVHPLEMANVKEVSMLDIGSDFIFSGYPLNVPGMITSRGTMAGSTNDRELLFIQAPVNKGNSGGALVNAEGKVIGIVTAREGGISQRLAEIKAHNQQVSQHQSMTMLGMDPIATTNMIIDTLDQYISVGIGYARNVVFAKTYLELHQNLRK